MRLPILAITLALLTGQAAAQTAASHAECTRLISEAHRAIDSIEKIKFYRTRHLQGLAGTPDGQAVLQDQVEARRAIDRLIAGLSEVCAKQLPAVRP